jgi:hypothetical protein
MKNIFAYFSSILLFLIYNKKCSITTVLHIVESIVPTHIICFKIKNPPTLHSTSKIQPTTSPTFVFSVSANVRKKCGYEKKMLTVVLIVIHRVFCSFYYCTQKVVTTFLYIIIILCYVNKLNSSMSNFGRSLGQPKKMKLILGIFFSFNIIQQHFGF